MPTDLIPIIRRLYSSAAGQALPDDLCIIIADYLALNPKEKLAQLALNTHVGDFMYIRPVAAAGGKTVTFAIRKNVSGKFVMLTIQDRGSAIWTKLYPVNISIAIESFDALVSAIESSRLSREFANSNGFDVSAIFPVTFESKIRDELGLAEKIVYSNPASRTDPFAGSIHQFRRSILIGVIRTIGIWKGSANRNGLLLST